jgi:hypothetical protein
MDISTAEGYRSVGDGGLTIFDILYSAARSPVQLLWSVSISRIGMHPSHSQSATGLGDTYRDLPALPWAHGLTGGCFGDCMSVAESASRK